MAAEADGCPSCAACVRSGVAAGEASCTRACSLFGLSARSTFESYRPLPGPHCLVDVAVPPFPKRFIRQYPATIIGSQFGETKHRCSKPRLASLTRHHDEQTRLNVDELSYPPPVTTVAVTLLKVFQRSRPPCAAMARARRSCIYSSGIGLKESLGRALGLGGDRQRRQAAAAVWGGAGHPRRPWTAGVNPEKSLLKPLGLVQPLVSSRRRAATSNRGGWTSQSGAAKALTVPANAANGPRVWPMPRIPAARMRLTGAIRAGLRHSRRLRPPGLLTHLLLGERWERRFA